MFHNLFTETPEDPWKSPVIRKDRCEITGENQGSKTQGYSVKEWTKYSTTSY